MDVGKKTATISGIHKPKNQSKKTTETGLSPVQSVDDEAVRDGGGNGIMSGNVPRETVQLVGIRKTKEWHFFALPLSPLLKPRV